MLTTQTKISKNDLIRFFKRDSEFLTLLLPILDSLYWNNNVRSLIENLPHFNDSMDLTELRNTLVRLGFKTSEIKMPLSNINDDLCPFLYIPDTKHSFLVLKKQSDKLTIIDSYDGEKKQYNVSIDDNGSAYFFKKKEKEQENMPGKSKWLYEHLLHYKWVFLQILIISGILNIFMLVSPLYIMNVYNQVIPTASISTLLNFSLGALIVLVSTNVLHVIRVQMLSYIGARVDKAISSTLIKSIVYLPTSYTESHPVGRQISKIKEFDNVREFFASHLTVMLFEIPFIFIFIITIWILAGALAFIPVAMISVFALMYTISTLYVEQANKKFQMSNSDKQAFQLETLNYLHDIKSMGEEELWLKRYKNHLAQSTNNAFAASIVSTIFSNLSDTLMMLAGLLVLIFGTKGAIDGTISLGALIAVMMLTWKTLAPIKSFFSSLPKLGQLIISIKQINALMNIKTEKYRKSDNKSIVWKNAKIEFSRISFRYRNDLAPALLGVNFTIKPNDFVCLIGGSGSGKSTVLKLLLNLYKLQAGSILLQGTNINQLDVFELRHYISYLPQNMKLFFGTIYQNILFANPTASPINIEMATRLAGVYHEIMALPKQFDTPVGDQSAVSFSASFQQKICLSRVFLKDSPILLLDEPENTLDDISTNNFSDLLSYYKGHRTIIMATHRPAHMRLADRVLYFNQGQLLFNDTPTKVLSRVAINKL